MTYNSLPLVATPMAVLYDDRFRHEPIGVSCAESDVANKPVIAEIAEINLENIIRIVVTTNVPN